MSCTRGVPGLKVAGTFSGAYGGAPDSDIRRQVEEMQFLYVGVGVSPRSQNRRCSHHSMVPPMENGEGGTPGFQPRQLGVPNRATLMAMLASSMDASALSTFFPGGAMISRESRREQGSGRCERRGARRVEMQKPTLAFRWSKTDLKGSSSCFMQRHALHCASVLERHCGNPQCS